MDPPYFLWRWPIVGEQARYAMETAVYGLRGSVWAAARAVVAAVAFAGAA